MDYRPGLIVRLVAILLIVGCLGRAQIIYRPPQQMIFNISNYEDVWGSNDGSTVYGSSSFIDNSSGCVHTGYDAMVFILDPNGKQISSGSGYMSASTSAALAAPGEYTAVGVLQFNCSCVGNVGTTGQDQECIGRLNRHDATGHGPAKLYTPDRTEQGGVSRTYEVLAVLKVPVLAQGSSRSTKER